MEEKAKCHKCYNCGFYAPYYMKGNIKFNKIKCGRCRLNRDMVNSNHTCDRWMSVKYRIKHYDKLSVHKSLIEILGRLSEIKQIIEEEQSDE